MLLELFSSVLTQESGGSFQLGPFLLCTGVSLILGLLIAWSYTYGTSYRRSFLLCLALLPTMVQVVIMLVNGNVGTGVAVMGAFSLVRFRSVPGGAKEIGSIFLAMAVGLATGIGYWAIAVLFTGIVCLAEFLLTLSGFGRKSKTARILRITIPEDLNFTDAFEDIWARHTKSWDLESVKTSNLGSLYKLSYRITLLTEAKEKDLIDELRCRNGNLEISCCKLSENEELL